MIESNKWYSAKEAADELNVTVRRIGDWWRVGKFPSVLGESIETLRICGADLLNPNTEKDAKVDKVSNPQSDNELDNKKAELERLRIDKEIALEKASIKNAEELVSRIGEVEEREQEIFEKESGINARMELVIQGEKDLAEKQEQDKAMLLARINRIDQEDKKHKEAREKDDAKRKEQNKARLSYADALAQKIYNPPPQSIARSLQDQLVVSLEPLMETFGLHPQFDDLSRYIPLEDRYSVDVSQAQQVRKLVGISVNGSMPKNIQYCYWMCIGVYRWMSQEPVYGQEFCRRIRVQARQLQLLVKNKDEGEIVEQQDHILDYFRVWHKAVMKWAEIYQNTQDQDWAGIVDWLCQCAQVLENKLGVGVVDDGVRSQ